MNHVRITPEKGFAKYVFLRYYNEEEWKKWGEERASDYDTDAGIYEYYRSLLSAYGFPSDIPIISNFCYLSDVLDECDLFLLKGDGYEGSKHGYTYQNELSELKSFIQLANEQERAHKEEWKAHKEGKTAPTAPQFTITFRSYGKEPKTVAINHSATYLINLLSKDPFLNLPRAQVVPSNEKPITAFLKKSLVVIDKILLRLDFSFHNQADKYDFIQCVLKASSVDVDRATTDTKKYFPQLARRAVQEGLYDTIPDPIF